MRRGVFVASVAALALAPVLPLQETAIGGTRMLVLPAPAEAIEVMEIYVRDRATFEWWAKKAIAEARIHGEVWVDRERQMIVLPTGRLV